MHRVVEPEVHRVEAGKLAQGALDAPCGHAVCLFLGSRDLSIDGPQICKAQFFLCDGQHPVAAEGIIQAVGIRMTAFVQHGLDHAAGGFVMQLFPDGIGGHQLGHVQHGIRVAGEHAGAGCTVHAALAALRTL